MIQLKLTNRPDGNVTIDHVVNGKTVDHTCWFYGLPDNVTIELRNMLGNKNVMAPDGWPLNTQPFEMNNDPEGWHK